jgi:hypothetical protein
MKHINEVKEVLKATANNIVIVEWLDNGTTYRKGGLLYSRTPGKNDVIYDQYGIGTFIKIIDKNKKDLFISIDDIIKIINKKGDILWKKN